MFGVDVRTWVASVIALAPLFLWELSIGAYMAFKGFTPSRITSTATSQGLPPAPVQAA